MDVKLPEDIKFPSCMVLSEYTTENWAYYFYLAVKESPSCQKDKITFSSSNQLVHPREMEVSKTDIALTTNPLFVDTYPAEQVLVGFVQDQEILVARLIDHPIWDDLFTTGEFWTYVGESWVKDIYK